MNYDNQRLYEIKHLKKGYSQLIKESDNINDILHYQRLFDELEAEDAQDKKQILKRMESGSFPFKSIAEDFKLIENDVKTIYIPREENKSLISRLRSGERSRELFRELAQYGVSVYSQHYDALRDAGDIEILDDAVVILVNENLYSEETGLSLEADFGKALFV